jgi:hypothetical protein
MEIYLAGIPIKIFYEKVNSLLVHPRYYGFNFNNWFFSKEKAASTAAAKN